MIYFSEIFNKKIYNEDSLYVGRLKDFIFLASENPYITKIVIENKNKEKEIISYEYVKKINKKIIIEKNYLSSSLEENELFLVKNLLDKQIIDIKGNKVVRVNDVALTKIDNQLIIAGVDIGFIGLLRRIRIFNIEKIYNILTRLKIKFSSRFLSWADIHPLELSRGQVKLKKKKKNWKK